jgi:hypothetical protein
MSALGQKQTYAVKNGMSALPPESDRESEFPQTVMSALPPKADMWGCHRGTELAALDFTTLPYSIHLTLLR